MAEAAGRYLLGIDAGNTVVKAVLFDLAGNQLAGAARDGATLKPAPGRVERDIGELWRNADAVIATCIEKAGIDAAQIAAIGCAGHGNGLYLLDKSNEPLKAVQSLDSRAAGLARELADASGAAIHALSLQAPWPSQTTTLLAWLKANDPDTFKRIGVVLLCKDTVSYRLTGAIASDISDMSGAGLVAMPDCRADDGLFAAYGLDGAAALLPDILRPTDIVGTVTAEAAAATGLAAGTPVVAGLFDVVASALGSGTVRPGQVSIIAGSWSINQVIGAQAMRDPGLFMVSSYGPDRFMGIEASATSAANLEWYVREIIERAGGTEDPFGYCNRRVGEIEPALDDPLYHPFLYGSGEGAHFRAGFYGIAGWHGDAHLIRALFEGVAFEHRRHVGVLGAAGVPIETAILSGGGSRSLIWSQMFADCLGVPVTVSGCEETGALGAAIAAGVGAGLFSGFDEAVAAMTQVARTHEPDPAAQAFLDRRYGLYQALGAAMQPFWRELEDLRETARS